MTRKKVGGHGNGLESPGIIIGSLFLSRHGPKWFPILPHAVRMDWTGDSSVPERTREQLSHLVYRALASQLKLDRIVWMKLHAL